MENCVNLVFNTEEINISNFLNVLKQSKDKIEKNNSIVYLDSKYLKQLMKTCSAVTKKENDTNIIKLSAKSRTNDYHYFITLELNDKNITKLYNVSEVVTNDPEYDGCFVKPNYATDLTTICFSKAKKLCPNKR